MDILIRDLPDEVHAQLVRRASAQKRSLRAYVVDVLSDHVDTLSVDEWLEEVQALPPARQTGKTGADFVDEARAEVQGSLARKRR
ncbi:MAG: FitA-like ribbon-helix-helix domain-containing protein [Acidimicrobiia bacterium]